jgi:hypothetical protein
MGEVYYLPPPSWCAACEAIIKGMKARDEFAGSEWNERFCCNKHAERAWEKTMKDMENWDSDSHRELADPPEADGPGPDYCEACDSYTRSCPECYMPDPEWEALDEEWSDWWEAMPWYERQWILAWSRFYFYRQALREKGWEFLAWLRQIANLN